MPVLKIAMTVVEIIVAVLFSMALGDYLGYKFGVRRVAVLLGVAALIVIVLFAIYAAVALAQQN